MVKTTSAFVLLKGCNLVAVTLLLILISSLLPTVQSVRAAPYVVTNTNNSGPGSLRQAITDANNNPGADTITFDPNIGGTTISLFGLAAEDNNASGDLDIQDGGDLTIQGRGRNLTVISGMRNDRVFHICPGGGCSNTVILSGMTIREGDVSGASAGGGITNEASTLRIFGCNIVANRANFGGGIYNNGMLYIQNSIIGDALSGNTAIVNGGGFSIPRAPRHKIVVRYERTQL